jgi:lysophospholipase L1-like esterase
MGARPMLYQTWGRRDGQPGLAGDDFYQMNARIREAYSRAADGVGGAEIIPVGNAWEDQFRKGNGRKLFIEDGSHPSDFGNRVSAEVFFESIFGYAAEITK